LLQIAPTWARLLGRGAVFRSFLGAAVMRQSYRISRSDNFLVSTFSIDPTSLRADYGRPNATD